MKSEAYFLQNYGMKEAFAPVDGNTAAITGNRVDMSKGDRLAIVIFLAAGLTGPTIAISLKQHNAASAGTTKALEVPHPIFQKTLAQTKFTRVDRDLDADGVLMVKEDTFDVSSTFDTAGGVVVLEVMSEDLDVNNGFRYVSVDIADTGVAKLVSGMYLLGQARFNPPYDQVI